MRSLFGDWLCVSVQAFWAPQLFVPVCVLIAMDSKTVIPIFLSSTSLKSAVKEARLRRVPELQRRTILNCCQDASINVEPGVGIDRTGEFIQGMALIQLSSAWNPLLVMNDQKRAM